MFTNSSNCDCLWPIILDKAFAKIYGSYLKIQKVKPEVFMKDLTGAPSYNFKIDLTEDLYDKMLEAS